MGFKGATKNRYGDARIGKEGVPAWDKDFIDETYAELTGSTLSQAKEWRVKLMNRAISPRLALLSLAEEMDPG
jgi:hypothetical protein